MSIGPLSPAQGWAPISAATYPQLPSVAAPWMAGAASPFNPLGPAGGAGPAQMAQVGQAFAQLIALLGSLMGNGGGPLVSPNQQAGLSPFNLGGNQIGGNNLGGNPLTAPNLSANSTIGSAGAKSSAQAKGTGYYPSNSRMEGGYQDMKGNRLYTLQDYLAGRAPYVSVAMDKAAGKPYGSKLRIPELERKYGRPIEFRVVDTGGAFKGKGTSRIDICTANKQASLDPTINGNLTLQFV